MQHVIFVLIFAFIIDAILGDPKWLWSRIPHPVMGLGKVIAFTERLGNKSKFTDRIRRINGFIAIVVLVLFAILLGSALQYLCMLLGLWGIVLEILIVACFLAQKSLYDHVYDVYNAFVNDGLKGARYSVSMIVGRNPEGLNESAIARAAIESLAENSSDGVIAPIFFYCLFGLPGLIFYKMVNTADSMIGHKNQRYASFGFAAARLDDFANFLPSRITALIALLVVFLIKGWKCAKRCFTVMIIDAPQHRSPNGGWPESVYAAFLGVQLSGPRVYDNIEVNEPIQNVNGRIAAIEDIKYALHFFKLNMLLVLLLFILFYCIGLASKMILSFV